MIGMSQHHQVFTGIVRVVEHAIRLVKSQPLLHSLMLIALSLSLYHLTISLGETY